MAQLRPPDPPPPARHRSPLSTGPTQVRSDHVKQEPILSSSFESDDETNGSTRDRSEGDKASSSPRKKRCCPKTSTSTSDLCCRILFWAFPASLFVFCSIIACMIVIATYSRLGQINEFNANRVDTFYQRAPMVVAIVAVLFSAIGLGALLNCLVIFTASRHGPRSILFLWATIPIIWIILGLAAILGAYFKKQITAGIFVMIILVVVMVCYALPLCCCGCGRRPAEYMKRIRRSAAFLNFSAKLFTAHHTLCHSFIALLGLIFTALIHSVWLLAQTGLSVDLYVRLGTSSLHSISNPNFSTSSLSRRHPQFEQHTQLNNVQTATNTQTATQSTPAAGRLQSMSLWSYKALHLGTWPAFFAWSFLLLVSYVWANQVIHNTLHYIISSKHTMYLRGRTDQVTFNATKRACSSSIPIISLASLHLALCQFPQCCVQLVHDPNPGSLRHRNPAEWLIQLLTCWKWTKPPTRSMFSVMNVVIASDKAKMLAIASNKDGAKEPAKIDPTAGYVRLRSMIEESIRTSVGQQLVAQSLLEPFFFLMSLLVGATCAVLVCALVLTATPDYFTGHYGIVALSLALVASITGFHLCYILTVPLQTVFDTWIAVIAAHDDYRLGPRMKYRDQDIVEKQGLGDLDRNYERSFLNVPDANKRLSHVQDVLRDWFSGEYRVHREWETTASIPSDMFDHGTPWMFRDGWTMARPKRNTQDVEHGIKEMGASATKPWIDTAQHPPEAYSVGDPYSAYSQDDAIRTAADPRYHRPQ